MQVELGAKEPDMQRRVRGEAEGNCDTKMNSEKLIDTLRAVLEETDIRIAELKKDAYEFKRILSLEQRTFEMEKRWRRRS